MFPEHCCLPATRLMCWPFTASFSFACFSSPFPFPPCLFPSGNHVISQSVSTRGPLLFSAVSVIQRVLDELHHLSFPSKEKRSLSSAEAPSQEGNHGFSFLPWTSRVQLYPAGLFSYLMFPRLSLLIPRVSPPCSLFQMPCFLPLPACSVLRSPHQITLLSPHPQHHLVNPVL